MRIRKSLAACKLACLNLSGHEAHVLLGCVGIAMLCHVSTLKLSPVCWQDEVQILDFGRTFIEGAQNVSWSVNLTSTNQCKMSGLSWGGCALQEVAYQLVGGSMVGPRFMSLLGLAVLVFGVFKWLVERKFQVAIGLACGLLVLLDPSLIQGVRGARVDAWAMAAVVWALYFINKSGQLVTGSHPPRRAFQFVIAGALFALGCFIWITTAVLGLILVAEVSAISIRNKWRMQDFWHYGAAGVLGFLTVSFFFFTPFLPDILQVVQRTANELSAGSGFQTKEQSVVILDFLSLMRVFTPMATLWGLSFLGLLGMKRENWPHLFAFGITAVVFSLQVVYVHRTNYLLPYAILFTAIGTNWLMNREGRWSRKIAYMIFGVSLIYAAGYTVLARNIGSLMQQDVRSMVPLADQLKQIIGTGDKKVLGFTDQIYYVGRKSGWQLNNYWLARQLTAEMIENPSVRALMNHADFIILENKDVKGNIRGKLKAKGWHEQLLKVATRTGRTSKYGPYSIWKQ